MKKSSILVFLSILLAALCANSYAEDLSAQITSLEQKAERIQAQINLAKQQADAQIDQQVKAITGSVDSLLNQRVQLDSHIAKMEAQMEEIKKNSQSNLSRQVTQYDSELGSVKQQISSLVAKQAASQKAADTPQSAAQTPATEAAK
jgi:DNA repair exonuclease SbcCD ATPase subunit